VAKVCELCANYRPATGQCLDYGVVGDIQDCARFVAADGRQIPEDFKPMLTVRIAPKEPEAPKAEVKPKRRLSRQEVVELIGAGKTQAEIAEECGVLYSTVRSHVQYALQKGELVRVGYGRYAVPEAVRAQGEAPRKEADETMVTDNQDALDQIRVALLELRAEVEQLREAVKAQQAGNGDKQLVDRLLTILEAQVGVRGGAA
jgi:hypothetical protein